MRALRRLSILALVCVMCVALAGERDALASGSPSVIEIAPPPAAFGTDAGALRTAAVDEVKKLNAALMKARRRVVVSLALAAPASDGVCNVNATVRDARTGALLAIVETATRADGPISTEVRKELAYSAVRSAVRRIPTALAAKK
jgi:hypothetical protein